LRVLIAALSGICFATTLVYTDILQQYDIWLYAENGSPPASKNIIVLVLLVVLTASVILLPSKIGPKNTSM
jgi:hypothetical protein